MPKGQYKKSLEQRLQISERMKGNTHGKGGKGKIITPEQRFKMSEAHKGKPSGRKGKVATHWLGDKNPNWKGGITQLVFKIRHSLEYKLWREAVFKRDNYTCIWCGESGGRLEADHIQEFSIYPELRFAIDNGRTLCKPCHKKRHKK